MVSAKSLWIYRLINDVLPTPPWPMMTTFTSTAWRMERKGESELEMQGRCPSLHSHSVVPMRVLGEEEAEARRLASSL